MNMLEKYAMKKIESEAVLREVYRNMQHVHADTLDDAHFQRDVENLRAAGVHDPLLRCLAGEICGRYFPIPPLSKYSVQHVHSHTENFHKGQWKFVVTVYGTGMKAIMRFTLKTKEVGQLMKAEVQTWDCEEKLVRKFRTAWLTTYLGAQC